MRVSSKAGTISTLQLVCCMWSVLQLRAFSSKREVACQVPGQGYTLISSTTGLFFPKRLCSSKKGSSYIDVALTSHPPPLSLSLSISISISRSLDLSNKKGTSRPARLASAPSPLGTARERTPGPAVRGARWCTCSTRASDCCTPSCRSSRRRCGSSCRGRGRR